LGQSPTETGKLLDSDEVLGVIVAVILSGIAPVFAALLGVATGMLLGGLLFRIRLTTDEGAAWSGISLGIPIGLVFAIIAFLYCFRRFRASGQPE
jgi:phosphotransferase system  glucose/maltose/N-acetylglucosamine-specific IIC component